MIIPQANRLDSVQEYYFSKKLREIKQLNAAGKDIINLGIGNPDRAPHKTVIEKLNAVANRIDSHGYQPYNGIDELRNAICKYSFKYYNTDLNANEVLPLIGSKEGITHITQAFVNPKDIVLIPNPGYATYGTVSNLIGANIQYYHLKESNGFQLDLEEIKRFNLDGVKLMWLNFPNMPTGTTADKTKIKELIDLAKQHRFLIINDNPYSQILSQNPFSIFQIEGAKEVALELNSLSKSHNMAGWRVGWVSGYSKYLQTILKIKSNMDSGKFLPIQKAAIAALSLEQDWFDQNNTIYKARKKYANRIFDLLKCNYSPPQVGMFVWAKIPNHISDVELLVDDLIQKAGVFITPGKIFGSEGNRYLRISLCTKKETFVLAIDRIKNYLDNK